MFLGIFGVQCEDHISIYGEGVILFETPQVRLIEGSKGTRDQRIKQRNYEFKRGNRTTKL